MFDFKDQHIVVVGGSSGIGLAVARLAQAAGADVTVMARDRARLDAAIGGHLQGRARGVVVDVADAAAVQGAFAAVDAARHVYVAAAGFVGGGVVDTPLPALRAEQAVLLLMANASINAEVLHVDSGHRLV